MKLLDASIPCFLLICSPQTFYSKCHLCLHATLKEGRTGEEGGKVRKRESERGGRERERDLSVPY